MQAGSSGVSTLSMGLSRVLTRLIRRRYVWGGPSGIGHAIPIFLRGGADVHALRVLSGDWFSSNFLHPVGGAERDTAASSVVVVDPHRTVFIPPDRAFGVVRPVVEVGVTIRYFLSGTVPCFSSQHLVSNGVTPDPVGAAVTAVLVVGSCRRI